MSWWLYFTCSSIVSPAEVRGNHAVDIDPIAQLQGDGHGEPAGAQPRVRYPSAKRRRRGKRRQLDGFHAWEITRMNNVPYLIFLKVINWNRQSKNLISAYYGRIKIYLYPEVDFSSSLAASLKYRWILHIHWYKWTLPNNQTLN